MNRKIRERIQAVWEHGAPIGEAPTDGGWRYVPRAYVGGGPGWGVWDRRRERFVEGSHLLRIPVDQLANEKLTN